MRWKIPGKKKTVVSVSRSFKRAPSDHLPADRFRINQGLASSHLPVELDVVLIEFDRVEQRMLQLELAVQLDGVAFMYGSRHVELPDSNRIYA